MTTLNIVNGKEYRLIDSQEEYDKELKDFETRINSFSKTYLAKNPFSSYKEVMDLLDKAQGIGLFSKEWCEKRKDAIIKGINDANLRKTISDKLRKLGLIK